MTSPHRPPLLLTFPTELLYVIASYLRMGDLNAFLQSHPHLFTRLLHKCMTTYKNHLLIWSSKHTHPAHLHFAVDSGANLSFRDPNSGRTALHHAAASGCNKTVTFLLDRGANIEDPALPDGTRPWDGTRTGQTPLHLAAGYGHESTVELLISRGANLYAKDDLSQTVLHMAATAGLEQLVRSLIVKMHRINGSARDTPLHLAISCRHPRIAKILIESGADIMARGTTNRTPLHLAAYWGLKETVELLISRGARTQAQDSNLDMPVYLAIRNHNDEITRLFFDAGGALGIKNADGECYLGLAVQADNEWLVRGLVDKGVDTDWPNNYGQTPLHFAAAKARTSVIDLLLGGVKDLNLNTWDHRGDTPLNYSVDRDPAVAGLLLERGSDIHHRNHRGETVLHEAVERGKVDLVRLLIEKGASIESTTRSGNYTSLQLAEISTAKTKMEVIVVLLEAGANPDVLKPETLRVAQRAMKRRARAVSSAKNGGIAGSGGGPSP